MPHCRVVPKNLVVSATQAVSIRRKVEVAQFHDGFRALELAERALIVHDVHLVGTE